MEVFKASSNYAARRPTSTTRPARNAPSNGIVKTDASAVSSQSSASSSQVPVKVGANSRANRKNRGNKASIGHQPNTIFWPTVTAPNTIFWPPSLLSPPLILTYPTLPNYPYIPPPPPASRILYYAPTQSQIYTQELIACANVTRLRHMIAKQIEYYFSDDNLAKDLYLKMKMYSEGWVPISLIASFKRVSKLTQDTLFVRQSLMNSTIVEVQGEKVRRRDNWKKWLLNNIPRP